MFKWLLGFVVSLISLGVLFTSALMYFVTIHDPNTAMWIACGLLLGAFGGTALMWYTLGEAEGRHKALDIHRSTKQSPSWFDSLIKKMKTPYTEEHDNRHHDNCGGTALSEEFVKKQYKQISDNVFEIKR